MLAFMKAIGHDSGQVLNDDDRPTNDRNMFISIYFNVLTKMPDSRTGLIS
jgi:hypothetical protein